MRRFLWFLVRPQRCVGLLSAWLGGLPPWAIFVIAGCMVLLGFLSSML